MIYIPDKVDPRKAYKRTTHLAIGAHPDDVEIMAFHGILEGWSKKSFGAVIVADGANSPRHGRYASMSNQQMIETRKKEQIKAAKIGRYSFLQMLSKPSHEVKSSNDEIVLELKEILEQTKPKIVYLHNLADKHETHVALAIKCLLAIRLLPKKDRPKLVLGCEVWRSLDWLSDQQKVVLPVSERETLAQLLCRVHDSQISGGKRYDLGTIGRRRANATFFESSKTDRESGLSFAMDLTPLIHSKTFEPTKLIQKHIRDLEKEVLSSIKKMRVKTKTKAKTSKRRSK